MSNIKKKLWLATEYFYPEYSAATGYFLTGIAEKLTEKYNVEVICASPNRKKGKRIYKEIWNSISIIRLKGQSIDKNNLVLRGIKFILLSIQFFWILLIRTEKKGNLCVVTNPAPLIILSAVIARFKRMSFTIIVHDIFPENLVGANIISPKSLLYRIALPIFNWAYSKADSLISMGSDMADVLKCKLPEFQGKVEIIPNWSDTDLISIGNKIDSEIVSKLGIEKKIIFTFAGNIGRAQGISGLLNNISGLSSEQAYFLFFGKGAMLDNVINSQKLLNNMTYCGFFPRSQRNVFLNATDVALIPLAEGMTGLGVPSKTYDYLAAGKALLVIADGESEISKLVLQENLGWVCPPDNPEFFREIVQKIINHPELLRAIQERARLIAEKKYSKQIILDKYLKII